MNPLRLIRRSISTKLSTLLIVVVVASVMISGFASYFSMESIFDDDIKKTLISGASATSSIISNDFENHSITIKRIAQSDALTAYRNTADKHALEEFFLDYRQSFPVLSYSNTAGQEEVKIINGERSHEYRNVVNNPNFSESEKIPNSLIVSPPLHCKELHELVIHMSYRLASFSNPFIGYVRAAIPLSYYYKRTSKINIGTRGFKVLLNSDNHILMTPDVSQQGREIDNTDTDSAFIQALKSQDEFYGRFKLIGEDSMVAVTTIPNLNWKAIVAMPMSEIKENTLQLAKTHFVIGTLLMIVVSLIAIYVGKSMTKPLEILTRVTTRIAKDGTLDEDVRWQSKDELGKLASAFNMMLGRLKLSQDELVSSRQELEDIIKSMAEALFVTDMDGKIIRTNPSAEEMLGYHSKELQEIHIYDLISENHENIKAMVEEILTTDTPIPNIETKLTIRDGTTIPVILSYSVLHDPSSKKLGMVCVAKDITENKRAEQHLNYLATHDPLTNLPNRTLFIDRLKQAMSRAPWHDRLLAVMFLDLDRFKKVNDTLGHHVGDVLLKEVAVRLMSCVRDGDTVSRFGGDEFVVMFNDVGKKSDVFHIAEKLINVINEPFILAGEKLVTTTSVGVSLFPTDGNDANMLLKNADTAMYRAKESGRNNYQLYTAAMNEKAEEQMRMEAAIRAGIDRNQFACYYQPQVSIETGKITGVEALVRWLHPEEGVVPPLNFLPLAEETGLIVPIGEQVLYQACHQAVEWQRAGLRPVVMHINISDRQFKHVNLPQLVTSVLDKTKLNPAYLGLELTEGILMDNVETAKETINELKQIGVTLSLDDFGTGYSSLGYLKTLSLDTLKIDRSFIKDIPNDNEDMAITRAVIQMGKSLGLEVVAEGVEDETQVSFLKGLGCETLQGFYFSRPEPADVIADLIKQDKRLYRT